MDKFFGLQAKGTNIRTEILAGLTTFFTMAYIIFVNPSILGLTGMDKGGVFVATALAAAIGTLVMGLVANVPYATAPGMGLNAFFTFTVVFGMGFKWQEALAMVFICGLINVVITVTKIRKAIIKSIPMSLQHAIGAASACSSPTSASRRPDSSNSRWIPAPMSSSRAAPSSATAWLSRRSSTSPSRLPSWP
jgi:AGZA family xanthine/uracil permease-like MFS transporter